MYLLHQIGLLLVFVRKRRFIHQMKKLRRCSGYLCVCFPNQQTFNVSIQHFLLYKIIRMEFITTAFMKYLCLAVIHIIEQYPKILFVSLRKSATPNKKKCIINAKIQQQICTYVLPPSTSGYGVLLPGLIKGPWPCN